MTQEPKIFPYIARLLQGAEVVWKPLGEVAEIGTGSSNRQDEDELGEYPFYVRSKNILRSSSYQFDETAIIIPGEGGIGDIYHYVEGKYALHQRAYRVHLLDESILSKFLFHYMRACFKEYIISKSVGATATSIRKPMLEKFQIPLPPLSVQQEIVRILDKFTQLEAELEAELDFRKRQYEYYRNKLLTFNEIGGGTEIVWKTLGEVGTFIRGNGLQKKDFVETGIGCIHYGQIYTYYGIKASETISYVTEDLAKTLRKASHNDLIIAGVSENIEDVCKCVVWEGEEDICVSGDTFIFKTDQNPHYIGHLLRTDNFLNYKRKNAIGAKVTRLQAGSLPKYTIPLPPLEEQQRIATILDKFDTLVNSISEGLPKEIALRRKQYEYYREKLLSFPKK